MINSTLHYLRNVLHIHKSPPNLRVSFPGTSLVLFQKGPFHLWTHSQCCSSPRRVRSVDGSCPHFHSKTRPKSFQQPCRPRIPCTSSVNVFYVGPTHVPTSTSYMNSLYIKRLKVGSLRGKTKWTFVFLSMKGN